MHRLYGLAGVVALVAAVPAAGAASPVVLGDGHVDYGARMLGGILQAQIKDGTSGGVVWREPATVALEVREAARTKVPADPRLSFLGPPGEPVWLIPQVQRPGIVWAGWNTEELSPVDVAGSVTWSLEAAEGPGTVAVFQTGSFGQPDVIFNTRDGLPDARAIGLGTHAHGNWAFSAAGVYRLTLATRAARPGGEPMIDVETLEVRVGADGPSGGAPPGGQPGPAPPGAPGVEPRTGLGLVARSARLRGRLLTVRLRVSHRSRVEVKLRRRGRTAARGVREPAIGPGMRGLRVRLDRPLAPGRYSVRLRARGGGRRVVERVGLRVAQVRRRA